MPGAGSVCYVDLELQIYGQGRIGSGWMTIRLLPHLHVHM